MSLTHICGSRGRWVNCYSKRTHGGSHIRHVNVNFVWTISCLPWWRMSTAFILSAFDRFKRQLNCSHCAWRMARLSTYLNKKWTRCKAYFPCERKPISSDLRMPVRESSWVEFIHSQQEQSEVQLPESQWFNIQINSSWSNRFILSNFVWNRQGNAKHGLFILASYGQ